MLLPDSVSSGIIMRMHRTAYLYMAILYHVEGVHYGVKLQAEENSI